MYFKLSKKDNYSKVLNLKQHIFQYNILCLKIQHYSISLINSLWENYYQGDQEFLSQNTLHIVVDDNYIDKSSIVAEKILEKIEPISYNIIDIKSWDGILTCKF